MNKKVLVLLASVVLVAAACNQQAQTPAPTDNTTNNNPTTDNTTPPPPPVPMTPALTSTMPAPVGIPAATVVLKSGSSILGVELTGTNGMTLYVSSKDSAGMSNCTGSCATNWPPYTVASATNIAAATGISGKVGTIKRSDGSLQVTYNGMPLYFWIQDSQPGDTTGNGVGNFTIARP